MLSLHKDEAEGRGRNELREQEKKILDIPLGRD
jgi:hypothetical protein